MHFAGISDCRHDPSSTTKLTIYRVQRGQLPALRIHGRMNILIERNLYVGVSEDLTETFYIHVMIDAIRRKSMTQRVKIIFFDRICL